MEPEVTRSLPDLPQAGDNSRGPGGPEDRGKAMSKLILGRPMASVLLSTAAGIMVGLLIYALLVTEPPVAYIVGVLATAGVTGWVALECLRCDWADRGRDGCSARRPPPSPSGEPGGPGHGRLGEGGPVHATQPVQPVPFLDEDSMEPSAQEFVPSFFRRPPTRWRGPTISR